MSTPKAKRAQLYKPGYTKAPNDAARNVHITDKRRWNGCEGKVKFPNEKKATGRAVALVAKGAFAALTAYECKVCGKWHLSKKISRS